jgi:hypothetical protein
MGMIIEVMDGLEFQLRSSNVDGKGNWGSLWLVMTDDDNGERARIVLDEKQQVQHLISELEKLKEHLAY